MNQTETEIKEILAKENDEFKRLVEKHHQYECQLNDLNKLAYLSLEQERQESELKKLKLKVKDEMEYLVQLYRKNRSPN